jgi:hypothetical protein
VGSRGRKFEGRTGRYHRKEREEVIRSMLKDWGKDVNKMEGTKGGIEERNEGY